MAYGSQPEKEREKAKVKKKERNDKLRKKENIFLDKKVCLSVYLT